MELGLSADLSTEDHPEERGRSVCQGCERPTRVCWCPYLPEPRVTVGDGVRVVILQHPNERKRGVRTALMAARGVADGKCRIIRGKKFPGADKDLAEALESETTFLLYPGPEAAELGDLPEGGRKTLVVLDGTWEEARKLYSRNPKLRGLRQVRLSTEGGRSEYVVRTQPADGCLSTVEAVARCLAELEDDPALADRLTAPLHALCNFQINHGEVRHDSKQFKGQNARFVKKNDVNKTKK